MKNTESKVMKISKKIFDELCKRVNINSSNVNFFKEDWYEKYKWSVDEGIQFKTWLTKFLEENPEAMEELKGWGLIADDKEDMARKFTAFFGWDYYNE